MSVWRLIVAEDAWKTTALKELNFWQLGMKSWDEVNNHPHSRAWFKIGYMCPPGDESFKYQYNRVASFLDKSVLVTIIPSLFLLLEMCGCTVYAGIYEMNEAFKHLPSYGEIINLPVMVIPFCKTC